MTPTQRKAIEGILAYFNSGNALPVEKATIRGDSSEVQALRAALEQPAAEPVAYGRWHEDGYIDMVFLDRDECKQYLEYEEEPVCLFTTPPPPADVPLLTPAEIVKCACSPSGNEWLLGFARAIEQLVRQKVGLK